MNLIDTPPADDTATGGASARDRRGTAHSGMPQSRRRRPREAPVPALDSLVGHSSAMAAGGSPHVTVRAVAEHPLPDGPDGPWPVCLGVQADHQLHAGPLTLHRLAHLLGTPFVVQDPPPHGDDGPDRAAAVVLQVPAGHDEPAGGGRCWRDGDLLAVLVGTGRGGSPTGVATVPSGRRADG